MTEQEIQDLIANQLKVWLMNETAWTVPVDNEASIAYTEERAKDGAQHIAPNLATAQMCHKYLAEKGKLP